VDDLNSVIEELQEKNFVLVGESMAASIAIKYVTKYQGKASKLVLLAGTPKWIKTDDYPYGGFGQDELQQRLEESGKSYSKGLRDIMELIFPEPGTEYLKDWGFKISQRTTLEITINSLVNFAKEDLRSLLPKIDIPTLIIHGKNDMVSPVEGAKYMHENISGSELYIFKDKGHMPNITAADEFNKILKEFITTGKLMKD